MFINFFKKFLPPRFILTPPFIKIFRNFPPPVYFETPPPVYLVPESTCLCICHVKSQLVHLRPIGILKPVMFNLYADLIIYSMTLKSPNGELSLEIVFCIVIFGTFSELFFIPLKIGNWDGDVVQVLYSSPPQLFITVTALQVTICKINN